MTACFYFFAYLFILSYVGVELCQNAFYNYLRVSEQLALDNKMVTQSSVLAWRIPGTGEPGGLPSMGSHRVGHD